MTKKKKKGKALGFLPSMKKPITPTTTPEAATTSGDGQPRPTERSTTSNDTGQLGPPGIPPDLNDHKEDSPVVTTDDTINTADLSDLNNDQNTQSETVATTVTNQSSKSEDDHEVTNSQRNKQPWKPPLMVLSLLLPVQQHNRLLT